jgi:hypothetical protein
MPDKLSYEQIKALVQSGELTMKDQKLLTPDEASSFARAYIENQQETGQIGKPGVDWTATAPAMAMEAPAMGIPGMLKGIAKNIPGIIGYGAAGYGIDAGKKSGVIPPALAEVLQTGLGFKALGMLGKGGAPAAESAVSGEEAALLKKGYPPDLVKKIMEKDAATQTSAFVPRSNVIKEPTMSGSFGDVSGGVQNNFRGRVTIPSAGGGANGLIADEAGFQRALEAELAQIQKMKAGGPQDANAVLRRAMGNTPDEDAIASILRSDSTGSPSPLNWHDSAPEGLGKDVSKLKRVVRRKPQ